MMSSWLPAWLPALPSIDFSLPTSIQKRFLSFALRQALGHLLKPGQLDVQQVDSQIGSGFVQVRDVELDNEAINSLIAGLPIRLHDGSVGKVTARIPWPNPLTAAIGLSLESLHLTFNVVPTISEDTSMHVDLAESVTSIAETFIHDELDPDEEATLRDSFHPDLRDSSPSFDHVPGGLDPFMTDDVSHGEDPPGVSIFATLLERLLSRFQFDATDIKITLVHPENASFTFTVSDIRYQTEVKDDSSNQVNAPAEGSQHPGNTIEGTTRTVTISGFTVTTRCLRSQSPQTLPSPMLSAQALTSRGSSSSIGKTVTSPAYSPPPSSPLSDSSELDEETHLMMSQSLVNLPPRPPSPASSVASSMYQSAISVAPGSPTPSPPVLRRSTAMSEHVPEVPTVTPTSPLPHAQPVPSVRLTLGITAEEIQDELILSLGAEPIIIRLVTPALTRRPVHAGNPSDNLSSPQNIKGDGDKKALALEEYSDALKLEATLGAIAVALRARHIRNLLDLAQLWVSHTVSPSLSTPTGELDQPRHGSLFDRIDAALHIRGLVVQLLPEKTASVSGLESIMEFFNKPLIPPRLPHGYVRIQLDSITASTTVRPTAEPVVAQKARLQPVGTAITSSLSLTELSIFAFLAVRKEDGSIGLSASPILITDPYLPSQYPATHLQPDLHRLDCFPNLPSFDIVDWTDPTQYISTAKLSMWRTKPPQGNRPSGYGIAAGLPASRSPRNDSPFNPSTSPRQVTTGASPASPSRHGALPFRPSHTAITVKFAMTSWRSSVKSSRRKGKAPENSMLIEVDVAPLHAFCDLALVFGSGQTTGTNAALAFLEELSSSDVEGSGARADIAEEDDESDDEEEDEDTPPATPRASSPFTMRRPEREQERERKRLERLVLEDLDLGYDYRHTTPEPITRQSASRFRSWPKKKKRVRKSDQTTITAVFPMIRIELRTSPHPPDAQRSGAVVLDIHDLRLYPGGPPHPPNKHTARFAGTEDTGGFPSIRQDVDATLLFGECERLVLAYSLVGEAKANALFSLGFSTSGQGQEPPQHNWTGSPSSTSHTTTRLRPQLTISRSSNSSASTAVLTTTTVTMDVPSVYVQLSKPVLDGLQLWADDLSQIIERCLSPNSSDSDGNGSKDPSLIGSRFFAKTRRSQDSGTDSASVVSAQRTSANTETIVKVVVADVGIRLDLPRQPWQDIQVRPLDIVGSNIDVLLEINPEGKDQTVLTLGVMDLDIMERSKTGESLRVLGLTKPASSVQALLKLRFVSLVLPETSAKESRVKVTLYGVTYTLYPDLDWLDELTRFVKAPPGVFESVVPSERTRISVKLVDSSIRAFAPSHPGSLVLHIGELDFSTVIVGNSPETSLHLVARSTSLLLHDDVQTSPAEDADRGQRTHLASSSQNGFWKAAGYVLVTELDGFDFRFFKRQDVDPADVKIDINGADIRLHLCADTGSVLGGFISSLTSMFSTPPDPSSHTSKQPTEVASPPSNRSLLASLDEHAFRRRVPEVGQAPDLVEDDLPSNLDYLDDSFGTAGGLRVLEDDDFDDEYSVSLDQPDIIGKYGGETIRLLDPKGLSITENYFENLPPDSADETTQYGETTLRVRLNNCNATVLLYDGYDWARTRRIIEEQAKEMRRRLAKIRQLVASGQTPDPSVEETNTLLFNSVYIGLEHNLDELEPGELLAAIDEQLNEEFETASQSSWQSLRPQQASPVGPAPTLGSKRPRKKLTRSRGPCVEFRLLSVDVDVDNYRSDPSLASRVLATVRDVEILDHIRTSTWSKFMTSLSTDSKGNIRETGSNMVRVELRKVYPVPGNPTQEARLRAKILPIRLYVDQDALDFMKKFFSFSDPDSSPAPSEPAEEIFFQQVEVFPVDLKLDYKPRRVDYRALRSGRTIELMNFFHFDGAEMTLRHITLTGITGWARVGDLLNDLWTPDVKATQLVEVISGVAPIRSVVNVGSGVADLVLLPIAQYKKDGRVIRGLQKGTTAFVQSTAIEAIKLGARLATGTQVILEQAEHVIGGQFKDPVTAEAVQLPTGMSEFDDSQEDHDESGDLFSRYAEQPTNAKEGVKSAVRSLRRNFNSAAQTILAVPMEVYERSGNEGAVRAVVRAVPIAVLKPMIGASEAVSKTLMGIHNSLDPHVRAENEAKYKHR